MKHYRFELQYINLLAILKRYIEDEWCNSLDDGDGRWNLYPQDEGEAIGRAYQRALLAYDEAQACFMLAQSRLKELDNYYNLLGRTGGEREARHRCDV